MDVFNLIVLIKIRWIIIVHEGTYVFQELICTDPLKVIVSNETGTEFVFVKKQTLTAFLINSCL